jgi:serine phosphatase RsbU (regulator of sigma subunit)
MPMNSNGKLKAAELEERVRQISLFSSLPADEIESLMDSLHYCEYPADMILFHEGDPGDRLSIVLEGQIEVLKDMGSGDERRVNLFGPGEFLGEMSLLYPDNQRSASAHTLAPVKLLEMMHPDFEALLHRQPELALYIMREMSARLRRTEEATILDLQQKKSELAQAYQELKAAQAQLIEAEKIEHELSMARTIQQGILPKEIPTYPGWQITAYWQPAHAVGGDFYDFIPFPGGQLGIVIGDVTGKGVPAALVMATTASILRAIAANLSPEQDIQPGIYMERVNELLCRQMPAGKFVTCLLLVLDPQTGRLRFANAGHCLPYQLNSGSASELRATGMPLGLMPGMTYDEKEAVLSPHDRLVMFSDGLLEAHNPQHEMFGSPRLHELLCTLPADGELIPFLIQKMEDFTGPGWEQEDDVTFVCLAHMV